MNFESILNHYQSQVNLAILKFLPKASDKPARIHEAMLYSLQAGGKRLRPILLLAAYDLFPSNLDPLPAAVAIECIHTYSLIHDDLPSMDNSTLRRGMPTSHIKFNEATALLAGDALLTYAFYLISKYYQHVPDIACKMIYSLSEAAGPNKLIGGQIEDFHHEQSTEYDNSNSINIYEKLDFIHTNKTAALISAALTLGLLLSKAEEEKITISQKLGFHLGMAFQINDDILDVTSTTASLGKTTGLDQQNKTLTYPKLYGLEESIKKAQDHTNYAMDLCKQLGGNNHFLLELITSLQNRIT